MRVDSRSNSPTAFDTDDSVNRNIASRLSSEEDKLETLDRKVSEIKIGTMFSTDNGNISHHLDEIIRKRASSETRDVLDSTEDAANDSFTDEEGETYNHSLRRRR